MEWRLYMTNNFSRDLNAEHELGSYLDQYYYPRFNRLNNVHRVVEKRFQFEGVDVEADLDGEHILIDEKGYLTSSEPRNTFAFELSYINPIGKRQQGWLYDDHKYTTYYLLCWNKRDEDIGIGEVKSNDFHYVLAMLVSRRKFLEYLKIKYGITAITAQEKVTDILQGNSVGRLDRLSDTSNSRYHYSNLLPEQPINIVMEKAELLASGAVDSYFLVKRRELKFLDKSQK